MKRIKKHIRQLHKIKIHHNRWFIWAIVVSFVVMVSLLSYIKVSSLLFDEYLSYPAILDDYGINYRDNRLGFAMRHPNNWGIESTEENIVEFSDSKNLDEIISVAVYEAGDEAAVRGTLSVKSEKSIMVNGNSARELTVKTAAGGMETVVLLNKNGSLYVIRGASPFFGSVLSTFKVVTPKSN